MGTFSSAKKGQEGQEDNPRLESGGNQWAKSELDSVIYGVYRKEACVFVL